jgi:glycosyltransferase involved in cell wall biosynthesis
MKLLLGTSLPYYVNQKGEIISSGESGGDATCALNLARELKKKGIEVKIVSFGFKDCQEEIENIPVIWRKDLLRNLRNNLLIFGTSKSPAAYKRHRNIFRKIFEDTQCDIYHSHSFQTFGVGPFEAASEMGIPTVLTLHNYAPICFTNDLSLNGRFCERGCSKIKFIYCLLNKNWQTFMLSPLLWAMKNKSMTMRHQAIEKVGMIITPSNYMKSILHKYGIPNEKMVTIHNLFSPKGVTHTEKTQRYFCWAGRIDKGKGIEYLLYAFAKVVKYFPEVKLYLIGDGRYKRKMSTLAKQLRILKQLVFTGWVGHEEVVRLFSGATGVVIPSVYPEIFPTIMLEAMGCAKAVIGTNRGGIPEIITDGYNGLLVKPENSNELAEKMIYLLKNPTQTEKMGKNALETIKMKVDPEVIVNKHIKGYQQLIGMYYP